MAEETTVESSVRTERQDFWIGAPVGGVVGAYLAAETDPR